MIVLKQYILNDYITDDVRMVNPMMEINGFKVRPGFFDLNGAIFMWGEFYSAYKQWNIM